MAAKSKSNELKLTRVYDAPLKTVWNAWTDPNQAAKWWGPRGFTITTHSKDLRPDGHWHYTMHGPDGTDYPNWTVYHEVEEYKRLVYDHGGYKDRPPLFRVTVLFHDLGEQTRMEMTMTLPTPEAAEETRKFIKQANGNSTWDRLAEYLENQDSGSEIFVINRSFDAPLEAIFSAWTEPDQVARWMSPPGLRMEYIESDISVGKTSFCKMTNDEGFTMYAKAQYSKIERPSYIQYTQWFCDEKGDVARHPMEPNWPERMRTEVWFSAEADQQTRVTIVWHLRDDATEAERQTFINDRTGMTLGWTGSLDHLEEYLISVL